jgi:hypothetical protein
MTMLDTNPPHLPMPIIDKNIIKWSGYFATTEQAQDHLEEKTKRFAIAENKLIVIAKKDFINRHFKGYFLYKFTVIVASK